MWQLLIPYFPTHFPYHEGTSLSNMKHCTLVAEKPQHTTTSNTVHLLENLPHLIKDCCNTRIGIWHKADVAIQQNSVQVCQLLEVKFQFRKLNTYKMKLFTRTKCTKILDFNCDLESSFASQCQWPLFLHFTYTVLLCAVTIITIYIPIQDSSLIKFNKATCFSLLGHLQVWTYVTKKTSKMH